MLGGSAYAFFMYQMQRAAEAALDVHDRVSSDFCHQFGRCYGAVEGYRLDDADYVIVMSNSFSTIGKAAIDRLRAGQHKIGLLRLRLIRPFPHQEIAWLLGDRRAVAVIDQNLSVGKGGVLHSEIASVFASNAAPPLLSFISGLGGRRFRAGEFDRIAAALRRAADEGATAEAQLLYSAEELEQMREMLRIAHGETFELPAGIAVQE